MSEREREAVARAMKSLRFSVKSADEGTVTAVFATFNVKDLDGDVTLPGAFEDGAEVIISGYNHAAWGGGCDAIPVGKGVIHSDKKKAWMEGQFWLEIPEAKSTFLAVKNAGDLQEWSYGYKVLTTGEVTDEMYQNGVYRVLEKLKVYEVSPVLIGAGIGTETLDIKSAGRRSQPAEPTPEEIAAKAAAAAIATDTMREFARFTKTRARLVLGTAGPHAA